MPGRAGSTSPGAGGRVVVGDDDGADVCMAYSEAGTRDAAIHVLLLHGLFDHRRTWDDLTPRLVDTGCHVVAPDLVGFGQSSRPRLASLPAAQRYSVDLQVRYLRRFVDALGLDDLLVVGNSLGGGVALRALCTPWPSPAPRIRGLILEAAAGHAQSLPPALHLLASGAGRLLERPWVQRLALATGAARALARRTVRRAAYDPDKIPPAVLAGAVDAMRQPHAFHAYRQTVRNLIPPDMATFPERYRDIDVPTLIVWGRDDIIVPPLFALLFEAEIPGSDLHVFDECGHAPHLEYPDEMAVLLRDWMRRRHLAQ